MAVLGTLIEQIRGVSYKPEDLHATLNENSVILLRANNIKDGEINLDDVVYVDRKKVSEKQLLKAGDILICASSGSKELVGKAAYVKRDLPMTFGAFCKVVRPKTDCPQYIGHFFNSPYYRERIANSAAGANINNIRNEHIDVLEIAWPSMKKQRGAVTVLDKVTELISLRKEQLAKLEQLVKSRFIELFGDPVTNPKAWKTKPLLDMGYCKNGMNFHTGDSGIEMHCLGVGDFKDLSVIDGTEHLPIVSLNEAPPEESMLKDGDIVFVRSNGNKALVGRCLVVYPRNTPTTYSGFCIRYRLTSNEVDTAYLLRVLKTDSMRKKMAGRGANIQNLNQQILASLDIPIPHMETQEQFVSFVKQTEKSKLTIQQSLDKLELLKKSLMQEYFG